MKHIMKTSKDICIYAQESHLELSVANISFLCNIQSNLHQMKQNCQSYDKHSIAFNYQTLFVDFNH